MKTNLILASIYVPSEAILKRINSTPTLNQLTRQPLEVGCNFENMNHAQFSRCKRMLTILGCEVDNENETTLIYWDQWPK